MRRGRSTYVLVLVLDDGDNLTLSQFVVVDLLGALENVHLLEDVLLADTPAFLSEAESVYRSYVS